MLSAEDLSRKKATNNAVIAMSTAKTGIDQRKNDKGKKACRKITRI